MVFRRTAIAMAALAALAAGSAKAAPILVNQLAPAYNPQENAFTLYQEKIINQPGIQLSSAKDASLTGLLDSIYNARDVNGELFNHTTYGSFENFAQNFGFSILGEGVSTGWKATPNADFSEVLLTTSGRNPEAWNYNNPAMATAFSGPFSTVDLNHDGQYTAGLDGIMIGPETVSNGFTGTQSNGSSANAQTMQYNVFVPDAATAALLATGGVYLIRRRRN